MYIRDLSVEDAACFIELNKKLDASGFMLYGPGERQTTIEAQQAAIKKFERDESVKFLVAEDQGKLVAQMAAFKGKLKRKAHSAYLVLGVDEAYRGQGVASELFQEIFGWAQRQSISRLELTVIKTNIPALNLYKKMGFSIEGEKIDSLMIDGQPVDEYYLYKRL
ncbi:GNAT family N-acetyltransferase [Salinicoccus sesuvii]|uniref:GNAT family N-acetyltransferase n=1 Tax=Salinicoccus sesuvii TaxID=868281 RepID=A0ABV7N4P4_9STAP